MVPTLWRKRMLSLDRRLKDLITDGSKVGWNELIKELKAKSSGNNLVAVAWKVVYDALGHDILIDYEVKIAIKGPLILQIWIMDLHPGFWIPEYRPWISHVANFEPSQRITRYGGRLADSKWRHEDINAEYHALLWGYVLSDQDIVQFGPYEKKFVFPG